MKNEINKIIENDIKQLYKILYNIEIKELYNIEIKELYNIEIKLKKENIKTEIKIFNQILKKYENEFKKNKKKHYFIMNYKKINYDQIILFIQYLIMDLLHLKNINLL